MNKANLVEQLKTQIIEALALVNITPADIDPAAPLIVEGLGLDSVEAFELILLLDEKYGIRLEDPKERRKVLASINAIADYILSHEA